METFAPTASGWIRDLPDPRDRRPTDPAVRALLSRLPRRPARSVRPASACCAEYFAPCETPLGPWSAAAHAVVAMTGHFERRAFGRSASGSCLFLHSMARRLMPRSTEGASLRATLKALKRFGLPPREHWPHDEALRDVEPPGFLFAFAREFQDLTYVRLDPVRTPIQAVLKTVKAYLAGGFPIGFGFTVFDSVTADPDLPFPSCYDGLVGGQTAVAVGYDDRRWVRSERGALRIRGPWGPSWGEAGYGWLPYRYVNAQLAADFWTILRADWLTAESLTSPL
jgi:C1A family cysteine protease